MAHPARVVVTGFAVAVAVSTALLMLPAAAEDGTRTGFVDALFTATSAVCVTGLTAVDTPTHWSAFGELVILGSIQVGGLGTMSLATLIALAVARRISLRMRLVAQAETKHAGPSDLRRMLTAIAGTALAVEAATATVLAARFAAGYDVAPGRAVYLGVFHAVSAFNNAGFALFSDNLMGFVADPWICLPIAAAVIIGGIGFPVLLEVRRVLGGTRAWSTHARITLGGTAVLIAGGTLLVTALEWSNPGTLGPLPGPAKLLAGFFHGVMPRTAGFNSLDMAAMQPDTLMVTNILMFVGGGSAGTAGGVKITTAAILLLGVWNEIRGHRDVTIARRRIPEAVYRQALAVVALGLSLVSCAVIVLLSVTPYALSQVLFEAVSAFGTVGLSTGITYDLPPVAELVLTLLMFTGRLGPLTLGAALALRMRTRRYDLPEERPIIG
ncbi:TrkH family potassium uptake protein [Marinitenerispora sediminis]|uniref:TrkH family potassium uptake protein n=1 Tax=Marinitenerispora sediminis TaxID=1931232 RepID=UPI001F270014|nr:potassium transporter TrkG [Marinitenerispora sediminis]